jgi:hypothetical protein
LHVFTHMQNLDLRKSGTVGKEAAGGWRGKGENGVDEYDQSILYLCMKIG